ncbi:MAG: MM0924 family protein [Pyrinomonadaceae bacterium]
MKQLLASLIGKKVDLFCGGSSSLRGEALKLEDDVLHLKDDDGNTCYVAVDKIVVVWVARDDEHRAGFVSKL